MKPSAFPAWAAALGLALGAQLLSGCDLFAGSSEVGNPDKGVVVTGYVHDQEESRISGVLVRLVPESYHAGSGSDTMAWRHVDTTAGSNPFSFDDVAPGTYNLEALRLSNGTRLLVRNIVVPKDAGPAGVYIEHDRVLENPVALRISLPDSLKTEGAYVYLKGTSRSKWVVPAGTSPAAMVFDSLPTGPLPALYYARAAMPESRMLLGEDAQARARDTIPLGPYASWPQYRRLKINTSATGANVPGTVTDYPLLVRLAGEHVDFSNFDTLGRDIRFSKADGTPLPFERESWNRTTQRAVFWVRMDTVHGNRDAQVIFMHFGKPKVPDASEGPAVFAPAAGWAGVWHMHEDPSSIPLLFQDATGSGNHAKARGTWSIANQTGAIGGQGLLFDGKDQVLNTTRSFASPNLFTVSLWFRTTTKDGGKLIGFGDSDTAGSKNRDRHLWLDGAGKLRFGSGSYDTLVSTAVYNDAKWHHVAVSLSPAGQKFYVDGQLIGSNPAAVAGQPITGWWHIGFDTMFDDWGGWTPDRHYRGQMDEVRLMHAVPGADWIRLSYENQRTDANLIHYSN